MRLHTLRLILCNLTALPAAVAAHSSLRSLAVSGCHVGQLPPGAYLQRLEHLLLSNNCFSHVPMQVMLAPRLRTLSMLGALTLPKSLPNVAAQDCKR